VGSCKQLPGQDHVGVDLTSHLHSHPRQLGLQPCPEACGGGVRVEQLGEQLAAEGAHALLDSLRDLASGVDRVLRVVLQVPAQILMILIRHGEEELSEGRLGQTVAAQVELDVMLTGGEGRSWLASTDVV
jgi:hypothetical protein